MDELVQNDDLNPNLLQCIFSITGELPFLSFSSVYLQTRSISIIMDYFSHLLKSKRLPNIADFFQDESSKIGLITFLIFSMRVNKSFEWAEIVQNFDNKMTGLIISKIVNYFSEFQIEMEPNSIFLLKNFINSLSETDDKIKNLKLLCKMTKDFPIFIELVEEIYIIEHKNKSWYGWGGKSSIITTINNFFESKKQNFEILLEYIEILDKKTDEIKALFYEPNLRTKFEKMLKDYITQQDLPLISKIFDKNIVYLMKNISKDKTIETFITTSKFSFSLVFETFLKSDIENAKQYIQKFIDGKILSLNKKVVISVEEQLYAMADQKVKQQLIIVSLNFILD